MNEHSALDVDIKHAWTYLSRIWTAYKKVTKDILPRKAGTKPPKAETVVKRKRAALKFMDAEVRLQLDQGPALLAFQQRRLQLNQLQRTKQESVVGAVGVRVTVIARTDLLTKNKGIAHSCAAWVPPNEFCSAALAKAQTSATVATAVVAAQRKQIGELQAVCEGTEIKLETAQGELSDLAWELETAQGEADINNTVMAVQQEQTKAVRVGEFSGRCSVSHSTLSLTLLL